LPGDPASTCEGCFSYYYGEGSDEKFSARFVDDKLISINCRWDNKPLKALRVE